MQEIGDRYIKDYKCYTEKLLFKIYYDFLKEVFSLFLCIKNISYIIEKNDIV